jgi:hypothetical protein
MVYGFTARREDDNRRNGGVIIGAIIRKENADRNIYLAEPYC